MTEDVEPLWNRRSPRSHKKFDLKRGAVIDEAAKLFAERGYEYASLSDLARRLGITKPTLYHYFNSKAEIFMVIRQRAVQEVMTELAAAEGRGGPAMDKIEAVVRGSVRVVTSMYGRALIAALRSNALADELAEFREGRRRLDRTFRRLIEEGVADGSVRSVDARLTANAIFGALNWVAVWWSEKSGDRDLVAEGFIDFFRLGLAAPGASPRRAADPENLNIARVRRRRNKTASPGSRTSSGS